MILLDSLERQIVAAVVVFVVLPLVPALAVVSTAIAVPGTVLLAWFFRGKQAHGRFSPARPPRVAPPRPASP